MPAKTCNQGIVCQLLYHSKGPHKTTVSLQPAISCLLFYSFLNKSVEMLEICVLVEMDLRKSVEWIRIRIHCSLNQAPQIDLLAHYPFPYLISCLLCLTIENCIQSERNFTLRTFSLLFCFLVFIFETRSQD